MCPKDIRTYPLNRILLIGLSSLGDNLLVSGSIKLIRDTYRKAELDILVGPRAVEFARDNPWFANYEVYTKQRDFFAVVGRLRRKRYDLIVDFRNSLFPFFLRGKHKLVFFLEEFKSDKLFTHESERFLNFLEPYFGRPADNRLYFPLNQRDHDRADELLKHAGVRKSDLLIVVSPGASFPPKRWRKEHFAAVAKALRADYQARILVVGGPAEQALAEEVRTLAGGRDVFNLAGQTTVRELAALLERASLLVTNDSGPLHLASAVQCPVVAVFGPGNPYRYGPIGTKSAVVHADYDCFPCKLEALCRKKFACLNDVSPADVLKSARLILDEGKQLYLFELE